MAITLDGTNGITTPDLAVDTNTLFVDAANNRVGVGTSSPAVTFSVSGDGPISRVTGSGGDFHGLQIQCADASGSVTKHVFIDTLNENGAAVANQLGVVRADGGSEWHWATQPAGDRTDRRVARMLIDSVGNVTLPFQPSIYLDGNNNANVAFSNGQNFLTSANYIQRHARGGISWNGSNGRVTVAVAGHYAVSFGAFRNSNIPARIQIRKNDGLQQLHHSEVNGINSVSFVLAMAANDYFTVVADGFSLPTCFMGAVHTYFTAHLLG